jgi:hypothetical protein
MGTVTKYQHDGQSCAMTHYGSIAEMEQDCLREPMLRATNIAQRNAVESGSHGGSNARNWYGVESLAKVKEILQQGYPEGAALVDTLYDAVAPTLPRAVDFRRRIVRADQGDELDIHAVNRGALDKAWTVAKRKARMGTGLIRIAVDICGNSYVSAEQLRWRGVAALALSRAMTKAGYSVEGVAGQSGKQAIQGSCLLTTITVTVKPRYAALDTATLAASICLPGFFRYLGFASIIKQADDLGCDVSSGLGQAVKLESVLPVPERIAQVVVPETVSSQESAVKWIKEALAMLQGATIGKETHV